MSAAFTKGPWSAETCEEVSPHYGIFAGHTMIAKHVRSPDDARLIAKSPELYRYLELALGVLDRANVAWGGEPGANAVLAEIRGEQ